MTWETLVPDDIRALDGALCYRLCDPENSGATAETWFPNGSDYGNDGAVVHAVQICNRCPVQRACLDMAMRAECDEHGRPLSRSMRYGIYGGLSPKERADLGRQEADDAA